MVWAVRAWVDDRHFAGADNISAGSGKRHRSGIAGDHPADQRRKLDEFAQTPSKERSKDIIPAWSAESMPSFIVGPGARSRALLHRRYIVEWIAHRWFRYVVQIWRG